MGEGSRGYRSFREWAVLLLTVLWLAGCSGATSTPPPDASAPDPPPIAVTLVVNTAAPSLPAPAPIGTASPTSPTSTTDGAWSVVSAALHGLLQAGPFRFHTVISTPDGKALVIDGEAVPPDRFHLHLPGEEFLLIGGQVYSRQGEAWIPSASGLNGAVVGLLELYSSLNVQVVTDAVLTGTDLFGGTNVHIYRYDSQVIMNGQPVEVENRVWISDLSGLPLRLETDGAIDGQQAHTLQDFLPDPSIVIAAPTP